MPTAKQRLRFRTVALFLATALGVMYLTDLLFFSGGLDFLRRYETVAGVVTSISDVPEDRRVSRSGRHGALYEKRMRTEIAYEYERAGRVNMGTRYFLVDEVSCWPLATRQSRSSAIGIAEGTAVDVKVARDGSGTTYVEIGWACVRAKSSYW